MNSLTSSVFDGNMNVTGEGQSVHSVSLNRLFFKKENAPTLIFIHGISGSSGSMFFHACHFIRTCQVLIYDIRGHGNSDYPQHGYTLRHHAADLQCLLKLLGITGRKHIIGYSYGGCIALKHAVEYGEGTDRVTVIDSPVINRQGIHILGELYRVLNGEIVNSDFGFSEKRQKELIQNIDGQKRNYLAYKKRIEKLLVQTSFKEDLLKDTHFSPEELKNVKACTQLIYALKGDSMEYGQYLQRNISCSVLKQINSDHNLFFTNKQEIISAIQEHSKPLFNNEHPG